jgi:VWFA-related protein
MRPKTLALVGVFLTASLSTLAQQPPPPATPQTPPRTPGEQPPVTFKVEINYVEIDAVVTDQRGNFIRTLTKEDFQVSEQGKPQTIANFSLVDIPVERADPPLFKAKPIESDVRSNRKEFDGRVFVLVLDDLNTHFARTFRVKQAARQFIERYLGANDLAAVVQTGGLTKGAQEFTNSRDRLVRAVDLFIGRKERSATQEKIDDYYRIRDSGMTGLPRDPLEAIRVYKARSTFLTLKNVSDYLAGIRGRRKAVVFFSEGIDYDVYNVIQNTYASDIRDYGREAIAAATRANVSVYSVDPRGLSALEEGIEIGSIPEDPTLGLGITSLQRELTLSQDSLRTVSDETGGFAAVNSNDFRTSFERIINDNSSYYVLGYYSTDSRRDGQFRNVDVRVKPQGLQVRARKGYVAPKGRPPQGTPMPASIAASAAMRDALNSPLAVSGLGLSVSAVALKGTGPNASVLVVLEIDGERLTFKQDGGQFLNDVEVAIVATDDGGKVRDGARDVAKLQLRPETHAAVSRNGVRLTRRLSVPPGRYQLKIGARESGGGLVGSLMYDLDVPNFAKEPLSMSGLLVTSAYASRTPTASPDPEFKDIMPASPSALRHFPPNDVVTVAADIYDTRVSTPHRVEIRTTVTSDSGQTVFSSRDERRTEELKGASLTFGHLATVPLKGLATGRYVLRVEAQALLSNGSTTAREVEFTVR